MSIFSRCGELFNDETTGKLCSAKIAASAGLTGAVSAFTKLAWTGAASDTLWLVFLGTVCGYGVASKVANAKLGIGSADGESK